MTMPYLQKLHNHLHTFLAQGLQVATPDDLGVLSQELTVLHLDQPAALVRQLQQRLVGRTIEKQDAETLIKLLHILTQADIQLSASTAVDLAKLKPIHGYMSVYVDAGDLAQIRSTNPDDILNITNPLIRNHVVAEYITTASAEDVERSLEILWFDASLSNGIVAGLGECPDLALKLAPLAFTYANLVMQHTALRALERVGSTAAYKQTVLDILYPLLKKTKAPLSYVIEAIIANLEGRAAEYHTSKQARLAQYAAEMNALSSPKVGERRKAVRALAKTKDPCFTEVVLRMVDDEDREVVTSAFKALVQIGGFAAIPFIAQKLERDPRVEVFSHHAAETLYEFGDRRGLNYFLRRRLSFALESYVGFAEYGTLLVHPILTLVKQVKTPENFKDGFASLFNMLRSNKYAQKVAEYAERDPELAEKLAHLMEHMYPRQSAKYLHGNYSDLNALKALTTEVLTENAIKLVKRLRHKQILQGMALTPDGQTLLTMQYSGGITLWNTRTWKKQGELSLRATNVASPQMTLSPDGQYVLGTNNQSHRIDIWKISDSGLPRAELPLPRGVYAVAATAAPACILTGGKEQVNVWSIGAWQSWEIGTWKEVAELGGHTNGVVVIQTIPGTSLLLTGDQMGCIQVWDMTTWQKKTDFKVNGLLNSTVAVAPNGRYVFAIDRPATYLQTQVHVWETSTWTETAFLKLDSPSPIICFAFTPDGKYLICGGSSGLKVLEIGSWREVATIQSAEDVRAMVVTPDGKYIVAGQMVWEIDWASLT